MGPEGSAVALMGPKKVLCVFGLSWQWTERYFLNRVGWGSPSLTDAGWVIKKEA